MYTICYVSHTVENVSKSDIEKLFATTQKNNRTSNITGILLFESGNFLQVLEGDDGTVLNLFEKIEQDSRHTNIFVILNQQCNRRIFENYSSGFSVVKSKADLQKIETYLDQIEDSPNLKYIKGLLEPFLL